VTNTQASFAVRGRNPDVLTCIANLSNDEVFTPPDFAGRMLDALAEAWAADNGGANIFADPKVTFLDPFTKSGVFLREITARLTAGLETWEPDLQKRVDHILTKQVFGIAITRLTSLLARRSVYCSKFANGPHSIATLFDNSDGNIWFQRVDHTWVGATEFVETADLKTGDPIRKGVNGKCEFCGAYQRDYDRGEDAETHAYAFIHANDIKARVCELFGGDMQFDVIIGNPPYQLGQSGGDSVGNFAMPIYHKFIQAAKALDPRFVVMVTPSRWFAGGRIPVEFRREMLSDHRLRELVDFPDAASAFPGVDIGGGVSYFLWDRDHAGGCRVRTIADGISDEPMVRPLDAYNIFVRYNVGAQILEKVWPDGVPSTTLAAKVSPIQPFALRTTVRGAAEKNGMENPVQLRSSTGMSFIELKDIPRNHEWIDQWKVILGAAYGERGSFPYWITAVPEVLGPNTAVTETYLVIDRFDDQEHAERFAAYLRTRFVRFLISLQKNTQHLYSERFSFVPDLPMDRTWTDEALYAKYGITEDEVAFIEKMIRPMGPSGEAGEE
jgi:site-specific DNA-methyltransferase (adenine-specific)